MSPFSPKSPTSPNSPSRTLPRNFKSYHEASGINALMEQPSRYSMGGSHTLPKNYKSPVTSPLGSPTKTRDPLIDLPVSWTSASKNCLCYIHVELKNRRKCLSTVIILKQSQRKASCQQVWSDSLVSTNDGKKETAHLKASLEQWNRRKTGHSNQEGQSIHKNNRKETPFLGSWAT